MIFLSLKPLIQAVLVEGMHAGALHSIAGDVWIIHTNTVVADGDQLVFADVTVRGTLIVDPAGHCVPLDELEYWFCFLHLINIKDFIS